MHGMVLIEEHSAHWAFYILFQIHLSFGDFCHSGILLSAMQFREFDPSPDATYQPEAGSQKAAFHN